MKRLRTGCRGRSIAPEHTRGRSAAYEAKGELDRALEDLGTALLIYAVEVDVLESLDTPDRASLMTEAAQAYRDRAALPHRLGHGPAPGHRVHRAARPSRDKTAPGPVYSTASIPSWVAAATLAGLSSVNKVAAGSRPKRNRSRW